MRKNNEALSVVAIDVIDLPSPAEDAEEPAPIGPLNFPSRIKAKYASLAIDTTPAIVRLLTLPGKSDADLDTRVIDNLGLENPDEFRISYNVLEDGGARSETRVIAVAYPDALAANALELLPASGTPAPHSIEVAGLATMTAFMNGPIAAREKDTLGLIVFGEDSSLFAFFSGGVPALIRKLDRGTNALLDKVEATLGVDRATAVGIISDGSFDISPAATEVMQPLVRQLVVSRDFVERRENCTVNAMYLAGGLAVSRDAQNEIQTAMDVDVETWNPFDGLTVAPDAIPEQLAGQEGLFAAAVGACMATFEES
jgi:Tfp pilus assembly PilM family ATPase